VGTFAGVLESFEVVAADGGLDITTTPRGLAAEVGEEPKTTRYVALGADRFIAAERDQGVFPVLMFVEDRRYLFTSRAHPRVGG